MAEETPKKSAFVIGMLVLGLVVGGGGIYLVGKTVYDAMTFRSQVSTISAERAQEATDRVATLVEQYRTRFGQCPTIGDDLVRRGLLDTAPLDPWGRNLVIDCADDHVMVLSRGEDGDFGTADDVHTRR